MRVLRKMMFDQAKGVLIIPLWKSAAFWPIVIDWLVLPTSRNDYTRGANGKGMVVW